MQNKNYFKDVYMPGMNKVGKATGYIGAAATTVPLIVLAVVYGLLPDVTALLVAVGTMTASFGILWFIEPISYYSILGPVGTYMTFLTGNAVNLRIPCATVCQEATEVKQGTEQGYIISTIGTGMSVIIHISILTIGVILGKSLFEVIPAEVIQAFNYLLPALFGAMLVQFAMNAKCQAIMVFAVAILINIGLRSGLFEWLPGSSNYLGILVSIAASIIIAVIFNKRKKKAAEEQLH